MPDGRTHEILRQRFRPLSYMVVLGGAAALLPLDFKPWSEVFFGLGAFAGYEMGRYVTPDWDQMSTTDDESRMSREIPLLGHYLVGVSSMYGSFFRGWHRSIPTHFPGLSTAGRHLLLFWWLWYQIWLSQIDLYWAIFFCLGLFSGNSISDTIHYLADLLYKE